MCLHNAFFNRFLFAGKRPPIEDVNMDERSKHIKSLIQLCWHDDPNKRPTMDDLTCNLGINSNSGPYTRLIMEL